MSENQTPETMDNEYAAGSAHARKWAEFVETVVVDFFSDNKLEKLSVEDGNGNKAKLALTKDNDIKLEYSTTKVI